jgi:hypothetical protein
MASQGTFLGKVSVYAIFGVERQIWQLSNWHFTQRASVHSLQSFEFIRLFPYVVHGTDLDYEYGHKYQLP